MYIIDFKQTFDAIKRQMILMEAEEVGITKKLVRLIKIEYSKTDILTPDATSKQINIEKGVRQGNGLSPMLLNTVLEWIVKVQSKEHRKKEQS